jgi:hypothetical protein
MEKKEEDERWRMIEMLCVVNENNTGGVELKIYCIQNDGDCDTCGLVNYGKDCKIIKS